MDNLSRRDFLKRAGISGAGVSMLGSASLLGACSSNSDSKENSSSNKTTKDLAALKISSDLHNSPLAQRLAFSVFDSTRKIVATKSTSVVLVAPSKKEQVFKDVKLREKGIKGRGLYSIDPILNESGAWLIKTKHQSQPLELNVSVAQENVAPFEGDTCPTSLTPTNDNPLDAKILCTRFEGECGLHKKDVPTLLKTGKPFIVLFATPARCQTNYCGPVLDLAIEALKELNIDIVHVEIYRDDTSNDVMNAVTAWNLPSEPWMFGVTGDGKISKRLDGAFDLSEIEELIKILI